MTQNNILASISVYDYSQNKLCDLYDSQNNLTGQAFGIKYKRNIEDGVKSLTFSIPYMIDSEVNFRWAYLKGEYLIRFIYGDTTEWFIAQKPVKNKDKGIIYGNVTCNGTEVTLKTKNIYMEFDDTNGIGTVGDLADKILAGTGWTRGHTDSMLEADGVTEKVRSLQSSSKQGALGLMTTLCNLFKCFPVYKSDTKTVELYNFNNRTQVLEGTVGVNLDALSVTQNSTDIVTRLYVEGEYGDDGYIGIDSVNPTGLSYIMNFDYYRELGLFTADHETALSTYLTDILDVNHRISANMTAMLAKEDAINALIGQCKIALYYTASGFTTPVYLYGSSTAAQQALSVGDDVVVLNSDGTFRYATIETTAAALIESGDYGIVKFITKAAGSIGAGEVQIEAKNQEIANLNRKIAVTVKADKIAEYQAEIARLEDEIENIYERTGGLYDQMDSVMNSAGLLYDLDGYITIDTELKIEQNDVESDFIIAMGDMLRDGHWTNQNYIEGQEQHLYDDANEHMAIMSRPSVSYSFNLVRLHRDFGIPIEDFNLNAIFKIHDDELDVHDNLFVTSIEIGVDEEDSGSIEVSNKDITLNSNDLGALLSRMTQLADLLEQKNTLYDRAQSISKDGTLYATRLNGQIDVLKNQLMSTVSNWHTDANGNIIFVAADDSSAMMLCGAGFMVANSKDNDNNWVWRTFGTGEGFTADEIVAGFISADCIESGSISAEKIAAGAITTDKLDAGAVTTSKLDTGAVTATNIASGAVTTDKLDAGAVTAAKIATGTITTTQVAANFGSLLSITGNPSITGLEAALAPAFIQNHAYSKGECFRDGDNLYTFTSDFAGGTLEDAQQYISSTNVVAQLDLVPGKISAYVSDNAYEKQSGITIDQYGVEITGQKYLKILSGGTLDVQSANFKIDSANGIVESGNWKFDGNGLSLREEISDEDPNDPQMHTVDMYLGKHTLDSGAYYGMYIDRDVKQYVKGLHRYVAPIMKFGAIDNRELTDDCSWELSFDYIDNPTSGLAIGFPAILPTVGNWCIGGPNNEFQDIYTMNATVSGTVDADAVYASDVVVNSSALTSLASIVAAIKTYNTGDVAVLRFTSAVTGSFFASSNSYGGVLIFMKASSSNAYFLAFNRNAASRGNINLTDGTVNAKADL